MAAGKTYPLSLVIKAVDNATAPLRAINAKIQRFTAPVAKLGNSFKAFGEEAGFSKIGSALGGVGSALGDVGKQVGAIVAKFALLTAGAAFALYRIVRSSVDAGDALAKTADRVGLTVDEFSQLQFAAGRAGVSQDEFTTAMDQFNKALGGVRVHAGPLYSLLEKNGPAFLRQIKGAKGGAEAFKLLAAEMQQTKDPGLRAQLAAAAFGKSGLSMVNALKGGPEEIAALSAEFARIAGSQEKFARGSEELNDAMGDVGTAFTGVSNAAMAELSPVLVDLAKQVKEFLVANRDGIATWAKDAASAIKKWVDDGGIQRLRDDFKSLRDSVMPVIDALGGFKTVIVALIAIQLAPLIGSILGLVGALNGLGIALGVTQLRLSALAFGAVTNGVWTFLGAIAEGSTVMGAFSAVLAANPIGAVVLAVGLLATAAYLIYKNWGPISDFFSGIWDGLVSGVKKAWDFIAPYLEKIGAFLMKWTGLGAEVGAVKWIGGKIFGSNEARPTLGAGAAAPPGAAGQKTENTLKVELPNLPKGSRVTLQGDGGAPIDFNYGISMVGGG